MLARWELNSDKFHNSFRVEINSAFVLILVTEMPTMSTVSTYLMN